MKALPLSDEEFPFLQSKEGFKWHSYKVVLVISYFAKVIWREDHQKNNYHQKKNNSSKKIKSSKRNLNKGKKRKEGRKEGEKGSRKGRKE